MKPSNATGSYVKIGSSYEVAVNGSAAMGDIVRVRLKSGEVDIVTLGPQTGTLNGRRTFKKFHSRRLKMGETE